MLYRACQASGAEGLELGLIIKVGTQQHQNLARFDKVTLQKVFRGDVCWGVGEELNAFRQRPVFRRKT